MRQDYGKRSLDPSQLDTNPIVQFGHWFEEAKTHEEVEVNAMSLATVQDGQPSVRIVLLKHFDDEGFVFFTNYESAKAQALLAHPKAALCFHWPNLQRQVRIEGAVQKSSDELSDTYYQSRHRMSRIGAWASPQSQEIESREALEQRIAEIEKKYEGQEEFPRPSYWGGFVVVPTKIEFWQGRPSRLHDRVVYKKMNEDWEKVRLAP